MIVGKIEERGGEMGRKTRVGSGGGGGGGGSGRNINQFRSIKTTKSGERQEVWDRPGRLVHVEGTRACFVTLEATISSH